MSFSSSHISPLDGLTHYLYNTQQPAHLLLVMVLWLRLIALTLDILLVVELAPGFGAICNNKNAEDVYRLQFDIHSPSLSFHKYGCHCNSGS